MYKRMQKFKDILILTKFRISLANSITALAGFSLGGHVLDKNFLFVFLGTFFLAGGASAVNEILEKGYDLFVSRTKSRPLPSGRMSEREAWIIAILFFISGSFFLILSSFVSLILGILTFVIYSFVYTPLKKITSFSLFVGAVVGAMPPLIGYFAKSQSISVQPIMLSAFIYMYQIPHTLSLFYIFDEDFRKSDFKTFVYLGKNKLKIFIIATLIIALTFGIILSSTIEKILFVPSVMLSIITLVRTLKDVRKVFSYLNFFMIAVVISIIVIKIIAL